MVIIFMSHNAACSLTWAITQGKKEKLIIYENFFAVISIAKNNVGFVHLGTTIQ